MSKISICMPTYNGARFIAQAIESALAQTYSNIELIIVDDGSTDQTITIAEDYATRDSRIKVHQNSHNLGLPRNWDRCRDLASGDWIMFLFQDDLFHPNCVEQMIATAIQHSASLVCCRRQFTFSPEVSEATRTRFLDYTTAHDFGRYFPGKTYVTRQEFSALLVTIPTINFVGEPTAILLRRDAEAVFGKFHPVMVQMVDFEYWTRIAVQTGIAYIDEPLVTFRVHGKSTTSTNAQASIRRDRLDSIVLLHDYLYAPAYAPLRRSLKNRARLSLHYIRRLSQLKQDCARRDPGDPSWQNALSHYPQLKQSGYAVSIGQIAYRLWCRYRRHSYVADIRSEI